MNTFNFFILPKIPHLTPIPTNSSRNWHFVLVELRTRKVCTNPSNYCHVWLHPSKYCHVLTNPSNYCHMWTNPSHYCHVWLNPSHHCHVWTNPSNYCHVWTNPSMYCHVWTNPSNLLLLVRLHDQSSSSDEVGGLLQVLQAPI